MAEDGAPRWLVVDGYEDEPAAFGVPPYVGFHVRYLCGVLEAHGVPYDYLTVDAWRALGRRGEDAQRAMLDGRVVTQAHHSRRHQADVTRPAPLSCRRVVIIPQEGRQLRASAAGVPCTILSMLYSSQYSCTHTVYLRAPHPTVEDKASVVPCDV